MLACGIASLAAVAASSIRLHPPERSQKRFYPRNSFIIRFLAALLIWNLATGCFNPFANAYLANGLRMPIAGIGRFFSAAQLVQVIAMLIAPTLLRRAGVVKGVMCMQLATAAMLGMLAFTPPMLIGGTIYMGYMAFQYMSEPGMYSLLMEGVKEKERSGASAMNFLAIFGAQAVAAAASGVAVRRFGYPAVLAGAAMLAVIAGLAFRLVPGRRQLAAETLGA
jgi:predicted MFS family arabinose efflux permease